MYFTSGQDRAFERLMQESPVSITTTAAGRTRRRIAAVATSIARIGNINTACMQSVPISRAS